MNNGQSISFSTHGPEHLVRLWVAPEIGRWGLSFARIDESDIRKAEGTIILKENRLRTVYRVSFPFLDFPVLVKSFHFPTPRRLLRGLLTPYADRELTHAQAALKRGIPVAPPLFLIRKKRGWWPSLSLIGYRFLEGESLYHAFAGGEMTSEAVRRRWLHTAGEFTARLHERGGIHRDYHAGNLFALDDGSLVLIDLYPLSFTDSMSERDRVEGLAHLIASLVPFLKQGEEAWLLEGYRSRVSLSMEAWKRVLTRQREIQRHHEESRARRCMENSSEFYQARRRGLRISARRMWSLEEIQSLLNVFWDEYRTHPENALKNAPESVLLIIPGQGQERVCVKWYRRRGILDSWKERVRGGRVLRTWKAGNGLLARGVPVAVPYAMVKAPDGGFLLMEALEGIELDRWLARILEWDGGERRMRELADILGVFMGRLHGKGIFHADLKACNIMIEDRGGRTAITLMDYDRVKFFDTLPVKFMVRNLIQLNNSVPKGVSLGVRYRFLRAYVRQFPEAPRERVLLRKVWEESRGKAIVYVTDQGDRIEKWEP